MLHAIHDDASALRGRPCARASSHALLIAG